MRRSVAACLSMKCSGKRAGKIAQAVRKEESVYWSGMYVSVDTNLLHMCRTHPPIPFCISALQEYVDARSLM